MKTFIKGFAKRLRIKIISTLPLTGLCLLFAIWISCEKSESFRNETRVQGKLSYLDIIDARGLILSNTGSNTKTDNPGENALFKITNDGVIQEITYWQIDTLYIETEKGTEVVVDSIAISHILYPVHIFDADENHLIVCFDMINEENSEYPYEFEYLVRKSDGAVFELPLGYRPLTRWTHYNQMFGNENSSVLIQRDNDGYIYYLGKGDIQKLSVQDPLNLTFQSLTTGGHTGEGVSNYRVNGEGHIIYNSGGISSAGGTRIRFNHGGLAFPEKNIVPFWTGFDNHFYYSYTPPYQIGAPSYPVIERLAFTDGMIDYQSVGIIDHPSADLTYVGGSMIFKMQNINKIVVMQFNDHMEIDGKVVAEVYNDDMQVRSFSMQELGVTKVNIGIASDNYYYLSGMAGNQPILLKVDATGFPHTAKHLVPLGSHDIYQLVVTSDDYVFFHGLRMSDGNTIVAQISPQGDITIMEDTGTEIIQLVQIQ